MHAPTASAKTDKTKAHPSATHPRVRNLTQHAMKRVVKLLSLYDRRINQLSENIDTETVVSPEAQTKADKALLSLSRMVLNLHKDLHQLTALLYPARIEQREQGVPIGSEAITPSLPKLTFVDNDFNEAFEADTTTTKATNMEELGAVLGPVNTNFLVRYFSHEKHYRRAV